MPKVERQHAQKNIAVRYPLDVQARIERVHATISRKAGDVPVQMSHVMNRIALAGLPIVEKELGISKPAIKPAKTA